MRLQLFAGEKTEPATPKRRQDARKKGQVFQSREVTSAIITIAGFLVIYFTVQNSIEEIMNLIKYLFLNYGGASDNTFTVNGIYRLFEIILPVFLKLILPTVATVFLVALVSTYAQVGFVFTSESLNIKLERLNPLEGIKRMFSRRTILELLKAVVKIGILGYVMYSFLIGQYKGIPQLLDMSVQDLIKYSLNIFGGILLRIFIVLIVLGVVDYIFQWRDYESNLRMSKEDIKEEFKETEGNPQIKSEIKKKQRQISMRRMMQNIKKADVVITNPTHIAVALMYDNEINDAPVVVAKGQDYIAQRIKEEAIKYSIAIVENKPLAQSLYKTTDIGDSIPPELYKAVAEVLAYVYSLRGE
ncbi:flagellar biosynthesis protein FlhB [Thermoanaerobacterium thermosaccharolyticum]|uniref:flagellar biosynthesis protein FlhB n=1 Tax=Thermoanaerobacterium thermosaccharolyticum TaxID=1517 RepID=UPI00177A8711|nr:flagellar biosynthesis protein FlhB [Thermoanaerobacterium thermosaccharolyticum]MBE0068034.1 flagellar biosynthesis protein FlhB [Thermoanaerobacterium thermosaccharolyticum]MBE0227778.1 flagellar biosynthesis protein FlhB [Thermoanaerobacterium thermosaccharolyticum]